MRGAGDSQVCDVRCDRDEVDVLCNARKHARESGQTLPQRWVDPFSSARQFHGWRQSVRIELGVVRTPATWLLHTGWQRHGEIDAHAIPSGPAP